MEVPQKITNRTHMTQNPLPPLLGINAKGIHMSKRYVHSQFITALFTIARA
jgi:hypothetical protein